MAYGKTIELFLVDGNADGVVTAELSNWSGKAIRMPRIDIKRSNREDIKLPGIYFLFCENKRVYIGEAENIQDRLQIHINEYNAGKESYYWSTSVSFVSRDLNKALIRYLENKLVDIAKESGNYTVITKNTYKKTIIKEAQIASMDEFIDNIKVLIKTLGYNVLDRREDVYKNQMIFYCKGNNANATGYPSTNGFMVLKGSKFSDHIVPSFKTHVAAWFNLRVKFEQDGVIKDCILQRDYEFTSPSAASTIVLGRSSNGNDDWKTENGTKLKDIEK